MVHDDHLRTVQDADADRGLRARGQALGMHDRPPAQLVEIQVGVAEVQEPRPELVLAGIAVLLDEAVDLQRLEQAVHGRPRELEAVGELADAQPARPGGQRLEDRRRTVDGLDRPPARGRGRRAIRHC